MKKRRIDPDLPVGKLTEVENFLPPPHELVFPDLPTVKVTIALNRSSIDFFKEKAKKHGTKYQRMIREVLDRYASRYAEG